MSIGENLGSVNLFGVVTIQTNILSIPVVLLGEGTYFLDLWRQVATRLGSPGLVKGLVVSGMFRYHNTRS